MKYSVLFLVLAHTTSVWSQSQLTEIGELPLEVKETSGLIYYNNKIITHNDSGNLPQLYELDTSTLAITRRITVANSNNVDWEDITQDEDHIYIADIGNNNGDRTDLKILKIKKTDYDSADIVSAEIISFVYEDQTDFVGQRNTDFDAEAILAIGSDLIVFTKQWQNMGTVAYRMPKTPGDYVAINSGAFQIDGLVTGATYDVVHNTFYLVGYSELLLPFFTQFSFQNEASIFSQIGSKSQLDIGFAQVEGIALNLEENRFYISSEEFINQPLINTESRLFSFLLDGSEEETDQEEENGEEDDFNEEQPTANNPDEVILVRPVGENIMRYVLNTESDLLAIGIFDASGKLMSLSLERDIENAVLPIETFSSGFYYATFYFDDKRISKSLYKN